MRSCSYGPWETPHVTFEKLLTTGNPAYFRVCDPWERKVSKSRT